MRNWSSMLSIGFLIIPNIVWLENENAVSSFGRFDHFGDYNAGIRKNKW
jgi:hypothetical protein